MYHETILIIEDDVQISSFIRYALELEGFKAEEAPDAETAMKKILSDQIDLLLLDLGLPDMDGMELLKEVRKWSEMPIIIVSARDQDQEKVNALDAGADDYLTKPFSAAELLARIRVAVRHSNKMNREPAPVFLENKDLKMDLEKHLVYKKGEELHVTRKEYDLLLLFMENLGKVLTYGFILKKLYGKNYGSDTQALRALMAGLRRKIEDNPAKPEYFLTEIGIGYRMLEK